MTSQVENIHIQGNEHWTNKGDAKLFLWEKRRAQNSAGAAAPSCSCTARRWPRSRPSICRCRDIRGSRWTISSARASTPGAATWRATAARPRTATSTRRSPKAPTTCKAATDYICKTRDHTGPLLVYGISSGALRAALFARAPSRTGQAAGARRPSCGPARAARRWPSGARRLPEFLEDQAPPDRPQASSTRSSSATIPAPPTTR